MEDVLLLTVIIYKPQAGGNYHHWALDVHTLRTDDHCIFQTEGHPNHLYPVVYSHDTVPESQEVRKVGLGKLDESQWPELHESIKSVEMQNHVSSWDCQEYVLDVIDRLENRGLVGSLSKYKAVRAALKGMRGDIESVHTAVARYNYKHLPRNSEGDESWWNNEGEEEDEDMDDSSSDNHELSAENNEPEHHYKSAEIIVNSDDEV